MKKILLFLAVIFFLGCGSSTPARTVGTVGITVNPVGGLNRTFVDCWFTTKSTGNPINLLVTWHWCNGFGNGDSVIKTENKVAAGSNLQITKYAAPAGYVLLNYFWAEISWTDDDGFHTVKSTRAYCFSWGQNRMDKVGK